MAEFGGNEENDPLIDERGKDNDDENAAGSNQTTGFDSLCPHQHLITA